MTSDQFLSSYDYELPSEYIAQKPVVPRDSSRLLVIDSPTTHHHSIFRDLPRWLQPGDLLVLNNTRVLPARLHGYKSTGAQVEVFLLEEKEENCWLALVKPGRKLPVGTEILFPPSPLTAKVISRDEATSGRIVQFFVPDGQSFTEILATVGQIPFPPYVTAHEAQPEQYQTVYAKELGAVAAPTAGLHFTPELLQRLQEQGINQAYVTLHVGIGTFRPVEKEDITAHKMHGEWVEVPLATVQQIEQTKAAGGRVIAVGTTVVRALEGAVKEGKEKGEVTLLKPFVGKTNLFIYPGYRWRVVEGLITNFHLPRSSLLMLVAALIGRERLLALYQDAIANNYRFYSFGDAMLILPHST